MTLHRQHDNSLWPPFDMTFAGHGNSPDVSGVFIARLDAAARQSGLGIGDQVCSLQIHLFYGCSNRVIMGHVCLFVYLSYTISKLENIKV